MVLTSNVNKGFQEVYDQLEQMLLSRTMRTQNAFWIEPAI